MYRYVVDSIRLRLKVVCSILCVHLYTYPRHVLSNSSIYCYIYSAWLTNKHWIDLNSYLIGGLSYVAFVWMILGLFHSRLLQFKIPVTHLRMKRLVLLMKEILHNLECTKPYNQWISMRYLAYQVMQFHQQEYHNSSPSIFRGIPQSLKFLRILQHIAGTYLRPAPV